MPVCVLYYWHKPITTEVSTHENSSHLRKRQRVPALWPHRAVQALRRRGRQGLSTSERILPTGGFGHGALAGFLRSHGVDALICGGLGGGARMAPGRGGHIQLYAGVQGSAGRGRWRPCWRARSATAATPTAAITTARAMSAAITTATPAARSTTGGQRPWPRLLPRLMPRPRKCRRVCELPRHTEFGPRSAAGERLGHGRGRV